MAHGCEPLMKACAHWSCACIWVFGRVCQPQSTCERGKCERGERAPVGLSLSWALGLSRGAALQRRHTLPCVHVLQLRVHTCHLWVEGMISWLAHNRCDTFFALRVCCVDVFLGTICWWHVKLHSADLQIWFNTSRWIAAITSRPSNDVRQESTHNITSIHYASPGAEKLQ